MHTIGGDAYNITYIKTVCQQYLPKNTILVYLFSKINLTKNKRRGISTPKDNCKFKIKKQMSGGSHLFPFGGYPCEGTLTLYITFNAMALYQEFCICFF